MTVGLELPPGAIINRRYTIQCVLGRGGFGRTYLAMDDCRFGELCVLKEFVPSSQGDSVVAQKLHELFQREATVLHKLNHPQIPKFFAVFEEDGRLFIAQEYIDGKTCWSMLQERQRQGRAFTESEILEWLQNLLRVLDYLHNQNIVHRDISPDNIMLPKGRKLPVLIDFGVVKQAATHFYGMNAKDSDGLIQASVSVGKFGYAPYEQIRMGQCSPRSDLYALAVTAVVLLTGKTPNYLIDPQSLEWKWRSQVRIKPQFAQVLERMMAEKPQDRYPCAQDILEDLKAVKRLRRLPRALMPSGELASARRTPSADRALATPSDWIAPPVPLNAESLQMLHGERAPSLNTRIEVSPVPIGPAASPSPIDRVASSAAPTSDREAKVREAMHQAEQNSGLPAPPKSQIFVNEPEKSLSWKRVLLLSVLALLPIGGVAIGVKTPYIEALCQPLNNCVQPQSPEQQYQVAMEQAGTARKQFQAARTVPDLQQARQKLMEAIAQLEGLPEGTVAYVNGQASLREYRTWLQAIDTRLTAEGRAAQLFKRAEAEAQKATEQTKLAKTGQAYASARNQWQKALETLKAIPDQSYIASQAALRMQEYATRLEAINVRTAKTTTGSTIAQAPSEPLTVIRIQSASAGRTANLSQTRSNPPQGTTQTASQAASRAASQAASRTASSPSTTVAKASPQPQPTASRSSAPRPSVAQASPRPITTASANFDTPRLNSVRVATPRVTPSNNSSVQVARAGSPGNKNLYAKQTVNNVSIGLEGAHVTSRGSYVANLVIENKSAESFGFVPVFAEVRNANNAAIRSRIFFGDGADGFVEPGEVVRGQIYILDQPWKSIGSQDLTLLIQEGTSGSRHFRITF